jgi:glycosyltransferase involved in cell wall biosynthesis
VKRPVIAEGLFSYQIGGSERVGVDLAKEFSRRGYSVLCFAFYDSAGPMRSELEASGIRCLDLNYEKFGGVGKRITYQLRFLQMLRDEGVSALHVHHATALILCGIPAALAAVRRVVMTEHGLYQLKERPKYRRSAARYCRFAHAITTVEPAQVDYFRDEMHVPARKLHYVANGVRIPHRTPEQVASIRQGLGIGSAEFAFIYVGRLSHVKDLSTLLQAFALLPADPARPARLYLAGDGPERASLERQSTELGLSRRVSFLGARSDVSDVMAAGDGFVMSSKTEGMPMALLEAMAAGLPCVATAVGGIPDLFAGNRGLLAPAGDPVRLSEQMSQLVRSSALRAQLASNAIANVRERYALDAVTDRYLDLLGLPHKASSSANG